MKERRMTRSGLLLMVFAVFCSLARAADEPTPPSVIHLASETWEEFTEADGQGLGWDLLRKVFEPAGVRLDIRTEPYTRATGLAQRGEVDACVGAYRDEVSDVLYPRWHFDTDPVYALGLASNPAPTLETLGNYRLAWIRGYKFQAYLPDVQRYNEVARRTGVLSMLIHNHVDYYIDALDEVDSIVRRAKDPSQFRRTHIVDLPLYLCFADTPRARQLMALFDQRMELLIKNGQLKPIFKRWKQPYPFEAR